MSNQTPNPAAEVAVTGHVYDGIQEYDNPLPGWWTLVFYLTILYSIGYLFINFAQPQWVDSNFEYEASVAAELQRQFAELGELEPDGATLMSFLSDPEQAKWLKVGEAVFMTNCVSCHGRDGSGVSGPNMTDDHFLNVAVLEDIPKVVSEGAKEGAMPAWGNRLGKNEIILVSAYAASLRGLGLPSAGGRPEEGKVIAPWSAAASK